MIGNNMEYYSVVKGHGNQAKRIIWQTLCPSENFKIKKSIFYISNYVIAFKSLKQHKDCENSDAYNFADAK